VESENCWKGSEEETAVVVAEDDEDSGMAGVEGVRITMLCFLREELVRSGRSLY